LLAGIDAWIPTMNPNEDIDKHVLKRYEIMQKLGKGAYGIVWKCVDKKTKDTLALKKNIWSIPERDRCPTNLPRDHIFRRAARSRKYYQAKRRA
jgi:hypothetical protein